MDHRQGTGLVPSSSTATAIAYSSSSSFTTCAERCTASALALVKDWCYQEQEEQENSQGGGSLHHPQQQQEIWSDHVTDDCLKPSSLYHYQEEETPAFPLSAAESTSTTNPALISKQLYGDGYYGGCDHESLLNPLPFDYGIHSSLKSCSPERATERFFGVRQFSQHQAAYHRGDSSTEDIADDIIRLFASSP